MRLFEGKFKRALAVRALVAVLLKTVSSLCNSELRWLDERLLDPGEIRELSADNAEILGKEAVVVQFDEFQDLIVRGEVIGSEAEQREVRRFFGSCVHGGIRAVRRPGKPVLVQFAVTGLGLGFAPDNAPRFVTKGRVLGFCSRKVVKAEFDRVLDSDNRVLVGAASALAPRAGANGAVVVVGPRWSSLR
jgi:hypothetical protein